MNKALPLILSAFLFISASNCSTAEKEPEQSVRSYGNTIDNVRLSADRIDQYTTYEVSFRLERPVNCISIELDAVQLLKTFPVQRIPERVYFIVDKKIILPGTGNKKNIVYTPMGRNFNSEWEIYTPVKICGGGSDPLSRLDRSEFRVRFTTFEKSTGYFVIKIISDSPVIFDESYGKSREQKSEKR